MAEADAKRSKAHSDAQGRQARRELYERLTFGLYKAPQVDRYGTTNVVRSTDRVAATIRKWRAGESVSIPYNYAGDTMLRVKDDEVQTSKGVSFPVADVPKAWSLILAVMEKGKTVTFGGTNGARLRLGIYYIDSISGSGDVKASCHSISYAECRKLAITLKLVKPTFAERVLAGIRSES